MAELELSQIEALVRICLLCDLSASRTNAVPGEGACPSQVFLIGEAPGATEDQEGRPFVGRAGEFLNDLLRSIGLEREKLFITGVVKCRPPKNREPTKEEKHACNRYLRRQIELIDPEIIVPMGRHATSCLFEMYGLEPPGIAEAHGNIFRLEIRGRKRKVVPTYHPAVLTHNPHMREMIEHDFHTLRKTVEELIKG